MGTLAKPLRRISKVIVYPLVGLCAFWVQASCTNNCSHRTPSKLEKWMQSSEKIKVLATTPIIEDLVRQIGGAHIEAISLMEGDIDPHSYEIVKGDSEKISQAGIIFANGLSLEHSASINHKLKTHPNVVFLGDEIAKKCKGELIYVDGQVDPHVWMDLMLWKVCIDPIVEKLQKLDPDHAEDFAEGGKMTKDAFDQKHQMILDTIAKVPEERRYLVTSHDAFNYFVRRYFAQEGWKTRVMAIQGLAPDEQISPLEISSVVNFVIEHNVPAIFPERNLSRDSLAKVVDACQRKGVKVILSDDVLFGDTMGGNPYLEMLAHNALIIFQNLGIEDEKKD